MSLTLKLAILFTIFSIFIGIGNETVATFVPSPRSLGLTVVLGEKQYYVGVSQKLNWYAANYICAARDMTLTAIESQAEYDNLSNYLFANYLYDAGFWISGSDLALHKQYTWLSSGANFNFTKWTQGQPPKGNNPNHCVATNSKFEWTTANCVKEYFFICSKPTEPACGVKGSCRYTYSLF
ncbi:galactose-specific lectin nattectin-like [Musca vetustissima]|uniref:galactose-specific lectin nattectin-like n=1 Tax=Musca vetustissima TaxID=27455 RepID=UPI002AB6CE07|nr:galactose-specific lectin nattectin-like [Musca vetustissima]